MQKIHIIHVKSQGKEWERQISYNYTCVWDLKNKKQREAETDSSTENWWLTEGRKVGAKEVKGIKRFRFPIKNK